MSELQIEDLTNPARGLGMVMESLVDGIRADLAGLPDDCSNRIHDIRVRSKKLWSLSKLARRHSTQSLTSELKCHLRNIKNAFSGSRDEEVMRTHLLRLLPGERGMKTCEAAGLLCSENGGDVKAPAKTMECAEKLLLLVRSPGWGALSMEDLCHRFSKSYRAAQEAMEEAHESPNDELMHDWRKRVKDVFYQASALQALEPAMEMIEPLDDLADTLGLHHDMAVLLAHLRKHDASEEAKSIVLKEKEYLEKTATTQGKKLLGREASDLEEALEQSASE